MFSHSVMSDSLQSHRLQHARLSCPSLTSRVCSNSCPLIQRCHPTISSSATLFSFSFDLFQHPSLFQWVGSSHQVARYWSFIFSISPSTGYSGLISFRINWFDLLAVQGTLESLLQHHSSEAPILRCSAFLKIQLSHPCMTTGKTIALALQTFVSKVMFLLVNVLSRFVVAFLPRSKRLPISWLPSTFKVILEPKKISLSLFLLFPHLFTMRGWEWHAAIHGVPKSQTQLSNWTELNWWVSVLQKNRTHRMGGWMSR